MKLAAFFRTMARFCYSESMGHPSQPERRRLQNLAATYLETADAADGRGDRPQASSLRAEMESLTMKEKQQ